MAKTLSFTDTSAQTVKIGDTTTSFTLICGNDNVATDLTNATSITVKLGNTSGYLKSATVDPASLTDPTTGQVTVTFNADLMTSLTAGSYSLEVWVVDSNGTSIYPSDGSTGFAITNNIQSANGSTITTITFDDFVKAMNRAASTIKGEKGDKGDTGSVDNAGLTTAPAFVALQTQVNNSAVGTNLFSRTDFLANNYKDTVNYGFTAYNAQLEPNTKYTISTDVPYQIATSYCDIFVGNVGLIASSPDNGISAKNSRTIVTDTTGILELTTRLTPVDSVGKIKIERGSIATDWCPNPSDILTQADYAKIKAAIVALGGSLS